MTYGLEMERAYSYSGTSKICHLLTYLDTYPLIYSPRPTCATQPTVSEGNTKHWPQLNGLATCIPHPLLLGSSMWWLPMPVPHKYMNTQINRHDIYGVFKAQMCTFVTLCGAQGNSIWTMSRPQFSVEPKPRCHSKLLTTQPINK